jgi:tripartite ATP-independent transporter DctM subunit
MIALFPGFFALLGMGVPVAFSLGLIGVAYIWLSGKADLTVVPTIIFGGMDSFPLLAIPFFILVGELAVRGDLMPRIVEFARVLIGPFRGGLAHVTIGSSMLFSGVTGVGVADCAAVGSTMIPSMIREGYSRAFAAAVTAASSVMGAIIPPSVGMLIIAHIAGGNISVTRLFLAGATPGVLIGLGMMGYVALVARRRNFPGGGTGWNARDIWSKFKSAALALVLPVFIIGGIVSGWFTPTEAGAVASAYALVLGVVVYRTLTAREIYESLLASGKLSAVVFLLFGTAKLVSWILVLDMVPQQLGAAMQGWISGKEMFLTVVVILFFLLGFVMEGVAAMIMLVPILFPIARLYGVEEHHLALIIVMAVQIALITPPMAIALFIVTPMAGCTIREVSVEVIPFIALVLIVIFMVLFFPSIAMWLPNLVM